MVMRGGGGTIAAVGAALALLLALPLVAVHVAGATRAAEPDAGAALVVVDPVGATAMLPDGTARSAVPWLQPGDADLAVAPSGRRLAFSSPRSGNRELYVADLSTGELRRLTWSARSDDVEPAWSPDGSQVVWASGTDANHDLFRTPVERPRAVRLTRGPADDREPAWAPNGRRIAFASNVQGAFDLWAIAAAGGEPELVHDAVGEARSPDWHPAGDRLAFTGLVGGAADVWLAGLDGTSRRVTTSTGYDGRPDWSPDGRFLAFLRGRGGTLQPWVVRAASGTATPAGRLPRGAREATWARLRAELRPGPEHAPARPRPADADRPRRPGERRALPARLHVRHGQSRRRPGLAARPAAHDGRAARRRAAGAARRRCGLDPPRRRGSPLRASSAAPALAPRRLRPLRAAHGRRARRRHRPQDRLLPDRPLGPRTRAPRKATRAAPVRGRLRRAPARRAEGRGRLVRRVHRSLPGVLPRPGSRPDGLRGGIYLLVQHANPERRLRELDYANNAASALVRVTWPADRARPPRVDVLRTCGASAGVIRSPAT